MSQPASVRPTPEGVEFDHTATEFLENPYPVLERLRDECPVTWSNKFGGFWVMSRYTDLVSATRDVTSFPSARGVTIPTFGSPVPMVPIESADNREAPSCPSF